MPLLKTKRQQTLASVTAARRAEHPLAAGGVAVRGPVPIERGRALGRAAAAADIDWSRADLIDPRFYRLDLRAAA